LEANIEKLEIWKQSFPRSVTPIVFLINAHKNLAWQHRGGTTSSGVSKKGNRNFQQHLAIAKHYIDSVDEETAELDPRFQYAKVTVNVGLGTLGEELAGILNKSITYDPEYYSTYTKIAPFLMPRWGGRPGVVEIYAERVSTLTEGEEMYARVADSIRGYAEESAYRRFAFDWNRVRSGFEDMSRKYPLNFYLLHANMWMACYYGDYELLRKLSDRNGYTWNQQAHDVWKSFSSYYSCRERANSSTAASGVDLHREIRKGSYEKFVELLNGDVDLNAKGDDDETVLTFAVRTGFLDFAVALIEAGADIEMMSSSGVQPIHMAARNGAVKMVSFLVERGASANARTGQDRWTPLHYAARYGHNDTVRYLLGRRDIEVNSETSAGMTPLHLAVGIGNQMIVGLLLDKKSIDVNVVSDDNETPLNVARANGYEEISRLLEFKGAKANSNVVSRKDRDRARDLVNKGIEEHGKREYGKAKAFYLQAIEADPNYSIAYGNVALVNMFENDYQACFDNVTKAIELDNDNAHAYYSAAQCLFMLRKPTEEYLPYYRRYTELEPDNFKTKELYQKHPELKATVN
jgi:ankyrin repeat protein